MDEKFLPFLEQAEYLINQNHVPWNTDVVRLAKLLYQKNKGKKYSCMSTIAKRERDTDETTPDRPI